MSIKNEFPEMLRDLWRPSINGSGQWINQVWYEPCHERALYDLLEKIEDKVVELLATQGGEIGRLEEDAKSDAEEIDRLNTMAAEYEETIETQIQALAVATREHAILQERLKDALEAVPDNFISERPRLNIESLVEATKMVRKAAGMDQPHVATKEQNGVSRPLRGDGRRVWEITNDLTATNQAVNLPPPSKAAVLIVATSEGIKEATAAAAYSNWCKFHGINARDTSKPLKVKPVVTNEGPQIVDAAFVQPVSMMSIEFVSAAAAGLGSEPHINLSPPPPAFPPPPPFPTA